MRFTKLQKTIILIYAVVVFFLCIVFVPWCKEYPIEGVSMKVAYKRYLPIWSPPVHSKVDINRLLVEIFASSILFGTAFVLVGNKKTS